VVHLNRIYVGRNENEVVHFSTLTEQLVHKIIVFGKNKPGRVWRWKGWQKEWLGNVNLLRLLLSSVIRWSHKEQKFENFKARYPVLTPFLIHEASLMKNANKKNCLPLSHWFDFGPFNNTSWIKDMKGTTDVMKLHRKNE
jgi:hypothetical protein